MALSVEKFGTLNCGPRWLVMSKKRKSATGFALGFLAASSVAALLIFSQSSNWSVSSPVDAVSAMLDPERAEPPVSHGLEGIRADGELVVLTVASPTTFRDRAGIATGYEVDLTSELAEAMGVQVRYRIYDDFNAVLEAIRNGEGHIAAPGLTQREIRMEHEEEGEVIFGPAYKNVRPVAVCSRGGPAPNSLSAMSDYEVVAIRDSGAEATLEVAAQSVDELEWRSVDGMTGYGLLTDVAEGDIDCAIVDSNVAQFARRQFPELMRSMMVGSEDRQLAWEIAPQSRDILPFLSDWFETAHQDGLLTELDERHYGHLNEFDYVDISTFYRRIETRLPQFEPTFRDAAREEDLDWTMLAAQGYQESHWEADARSPTGVRGLMMLTRPTAREVGVTDRLDPEQSIYGGAEYMRRIYERLPDGVSGYDRLWMAMAAYNVGYGHLLDARTLARRQNLDPDRWSNISRMLPLLTEREYHSTVRHGYARGYEPVRYVRRIREYDEVLTANVEAPERPPFRMDNAGVPIPPPEPATPLP